jgi:hypothetical protein
LLLFFICFWGGGAVFWGNLKGEMYEVGPTVQ